MFSLCGMDYLEDLDLRSFNTSSVQYMEAMFDSCTALRAIYVTSSFVTTSVIDDGYGMFAGCYNLVGGGGTAYADYDWIDDYTFARIDNPPNNRGYFSTLA